MLSDREYITQSLELNLFFMRIAKEHSKFIRGLLDCKIRSIVLPLLGDHVVREANHYIRLLKGVKPGERDQEK